MFTGYTNRAFREKSTRDSSTLYLGALGPLINSEVGDVIKIVFYNKLNESLAITPTGLRTNKQYEGINYNDDIIGENKRRENMACIFLLWFILFIIEILMFPKQSLFFFSNANICYNRQHMKKNPQSLIVIF